MEVNRKSNRPLSLLALVMINVIAIDSLRNLPANAQTGFHIIFYYAVCAVLFLLPCVLITAQLASHFPERGGVYVWVKKAFGVKTAFICIWLQWIYNVVWYPTILSFMAVNIAFFFNPDLANHKMYVISVVIILFAFATIISNQGMKTSGLVSTLSAIIGTLIPMLALIILGIAAALSNGTSMQSFTLSNIIPSSISDSAFVLIVLFSLMGLEMSAVHAKEVKQPERNYPKALLYSSIVIVLTLCLASLSISIIVPNNQLGIINGLDVALKMVLNQFHLTFLFPILIFMVIIGGFGSVSAWVIGPSKAMMVAANDGCLPPLLGYRNQHQSPSGMLLLQLILVIFLSYCMVAFEPIQASYWLLADLTAQLALLFYIFFFAAAIKLYRQLPEDKQSFRIPGGLIGTYLIGGIGIVTCFIGVIIGFIPPGNLMETSTVYYELFLVLGLVLSAVAPLIIIRYTQRCSNKTE